VTLRTLITAGAGSRGFAHPVKVDVRLVSFPCPAFEMTWLQTYDPLHNVALSTAVAALPIVLLLSAIGVFKIRIHFAALLGLAIALTIAIFVFGMPAGAAAATVVYGAGFGLFPIGWIILNLIIFCIN
jgi:uncharacterized membrane protein YGL010W